MYTLNTLCIDLIKIVVQIKTHCAYNLSCLTVLHTALPLFFHYSIDTFQERKVHLKIPCKYKLY
jgi:hypothetical protein